MSGDRSHRWPVVRYAAVWLLGGCLAAALVVASLRGTSDAVPDERPPLAARPTPSPVPGCVVRRDTGAATPSAVRVMQPPTVGPRATPASVGVHRRPPSPAALVGALRRGYVVVQYRPSLERDVVRTLEREFGRGTPPTVVTPDGTGMRFAVAVTAWSRLLGCSSAEGDVLDAAQDFRRRYAGVGPDARP